MAKFVYLNVNPDGSKESDCVTRAISLATGIPYPEIRKKLFHVSRLLNCEKLCMCCYRHLLDDTFKFKTVYCDGYTVEEFADKHPYGSYLVRVPSHLTTIIDNTIYDIWDCRNEPCDVVWRVE